MVALLLDSLLSDDVDEDSGALVISDALVMRVGSAVTVAEGWTTLDED